MAITILFANCSDKKDKLFTSLTDSQTGIKFRNVLEESDEFNVLNYQYFYNGSGVATGDINNDGLVDICFAGNMVKNRLYLNKGNCEFEDITPKSTIADKQGWCTGVTMVDINADGWLDIYICRSADGDASKRRNLLFINNKDLTFTEKAAEYGLADEGYSIHSAFFDMDKDGDLDMFLLNHSTNEFAGFKREMFSLKQQKNPLYGSKLYRNDGGKFTDVTEGAGIVNNVLSFGLGIVVFDANNDGWSDIYVSNDFNEEDYLFVNQKNGTFKEQVRNAFDQVSLFSMGSDAADINNDGKIDLLTLDMLPEDNRTQKMHSGAENYDKIQMLFQNGFYYQYSRNMLHLNNGDGTFSEIGQMAGVSNTDWSWAALFADYDNDGQKDLFVTNGYVKDYTEMDFLKYSAEKASQQQKRSDIIKDLLKKMPGSKTENYMFKNNGNLTFSKVTNEWGINSSGFSAGAAYSDIDNDGDLDLIVNKINETAGVFRNNAETLLKNNYIKIKLVGDAQNTFGMGSKVTVFSNGQKQLQELMPSRGYESSVDYTLLFGLGKNTPIDSIKVVWSDDKTQVINKVQINQTLIIDKKDTSTTQNSPSISTRDFGVNPLSIKPFFTLVGGIDFLHTENEFQDFKTQTLLPHFLSRSGPCIGKGDINGDGLEDIFFGGAKGVSGSIFIQKANGSFSQKNNPVMDLDAISEDGGAEFFDADGDKDLDLYVSSGGYEFPQNDAALQDRLYLNDGKGNFTKSTQALPQETNSGSCVRAGDFDGDGDLDLFVGGYVMPTKYPVPPLSMLLINDGKGNFINKITEIAPNLTAIGMVRDAVWTDVNGDKVLDLIVVGEWMPATVFINKKGKLVNDANWLIPYSAGWWNCLLVQDFDGDGDMDFVAGNLGLNSQLRASQTHPVEIYYNDFDKNGSIDPVMTYYIGSEKSLVASRDDLLDQIAFLKKKYTTYAAYSKTTFDDLFSAEQKMGMQSLLCTQFQSCYFENTGDGFKMTPLSIEAQMAPIYAWAVVDANKDGNKDLIAAGNNISTRVKYGRYRANHGLLLMGDGKGGFQYIPQTKSGFNIRGDVRSMITTQKNGVTQLIIGLNNDKSLMYRLNK